VSALGLFWLGLNCSFPSTISIQPVSEPLTAASVISRLYRRTRLLIEWSEQYVSDQRPVAATDNRVFLEGQRVLTDLVKTGDACPHDAGDEAEGSALR
jgi:hypothetical protein